MSTKQRSNLPHREALLQEGLRQFFKVGYHATTVDGLLVATGVPKGSFYHHFGSKESFAAVVIQRYREFHHDSLNRWIARDDLSTADKLTGYLKQLSDNFISSGYLYSNLVGKLITEVAASSPLLRDEIGDMLSTWRAQVVGLLERGQAMGDVRPDRSAFDMATSINAIIDGAFLVAQSTHEDVLFDAAASAIRRLVEPPA